MTKELSVIQQDLCSRLGADYRACAMDSKVGISLGVREGLRPLNGLRLEPEEGTSGRFIWAGTEWSDEPDFFVPLHASHLSRWAPDVLPYLGLAPGWRFLIDTNYEDVWQDAQLIRGGS